MKKATLTTVTTTARPKLFQSETEDRMRHTTKITSPHQCAQEPLCGGTVVSENVHRKKGEMTAASAAVKSRKAPAAQYGQEKYRVKWSLEAARRERFSQMSTASPDILSFQQKRISLKLLCFAAHNKGTIR